MGMTLPLEAIKNGASYAIVSERCLDKNDKIIPVSDPLQNTSRSSEIAS